MEVRWVVGPTSALAGRGVLGGGGQGDVVAEGLELGDQVAGASFGVDSFGVVVGAEVVVGGGGVVASRWKMMTRMERCRAARALALGMRLISRR